MKTLKQKRKFLILKLFCGCKTVRKPRYKTHNEFLRAAALEQQDAEKTAAGYPEDKTSLN
jgi:hypothetical protein